MLHMSYLYQTLASILNYFIHSISYHPFQHPSPLPNSSIHPKLFHTLEIFPSISHSSIHSILFHPFQTLSSILAPFIHYSPFHLFHNISFIPDSRAERSPRHVCQQVRPNPLGSVTPGLKSHSLRKSGRDGPRCRQGHRLQGPELEGNQNTQIKYDHHDTLDVYVFLFGGTLFGVRQSYPVRAS